MYKDAGWWLLIALIILILVYSNRASADDCLPVSELAETVMEARQKGVSMASMMAVEPGGELLKAMVVEAYGRSRYNTAEYQRKTIEDFRDAWYLACVQGSD